MAEFVLTPEGRKLELEAADLAFSRAASVPSTDQPDVAAVPKRDDSSGAPAKRGPGRPKGSVKEAKPVAVVPVKESYTEDVQSLVSAVWTVSASIPYTQAYALVLSTNADSLVDAVSDAAKHNATARKWVSQGSEASWQLKLGAVAVSMGSQVFQLLKDPELRAQAAEATRKQLMETLEAQGLLPEESRPNDAPAPQPS